VACLLVGFLATPSDSSAQSLNPDKPAPMAANASRAAVDSFVGAHYWTFTAQPGRFVVDLTLGNKDGGMLGLDRVRASMSFAPKTPGATLTVKATKSDTVYEGSVTEPTRVVVEIAPRKGTLLRETTDYTLDVSGNVSFNAADADDSQSIVGAYIAKVNSYGAVKFQSDGRVMAANGAEGVWKLFDAAAKVYSITMNDRFRYTVILTPGRGLMDVHSKTLDFELLRQ
jgi:hypothetical protein